MLDDKLEKIYPFLYEAHNEAEDAKKKLAKFLGEKCIYFKEKGLISS